MSKCEDINEVWCENIKRNSYYFAKLLDCYQGEHYLVVDDYETGKEINIDIKPYFNQIWEGRGQKHDLTEEYICAFLWQLILQGKLQYIVQKTPQCFSDYQILENDKLVKSYVDCVVTYDNLAKGKIISAAFWGGNTDSDGYIKFDEEPISLPKEDISEEDMIIRNKCFEDLKALGIKECKEAQYPLEIGYCRPAQLLFHFMNTWCVARLPYNQEYIIYFKTKVFSVKL